MREACPVADEIGQRCDRRNELDPARQRNRTKCFDRILYDLFEVDLLALNREPARVDLGEEEQVADEMEQPLRVPVHDTEEPFLFGREVVALLEQELEIAADRRERRA